MKISRNADLIEIRCEELGFIGHATSGAIAGKIDGRPFVWTGNGDLVEMLNYASDRHLELYIRLSVRAQNLDWRLEAARK